MQGANRKKLAVYVTSKLSLVEKEVENVINNSGKDNDDLKNKYCPITDLVLFKNSKELFPLVQPYISLPNKGAQSKL